MRKTERFLRYSYWNFQSLYTFKYILKTHQPSEFPLVITFFNPLLQYTVCNAKDLIFGPNVSHAVLNLSRPKEKDTSWKAQVRLLVNLLQHQNSALVAAERIVKAQSQQSDRFSSLSEETLQYRRISCAFKKQKTFRVTLKNSNFICWSIPLWGGGGGVLYLTAPDKGVLFQNVPFWIYFWSSKPHPTSSFFVLVAFIYIY